VKAAKIAWGDVQDKLQGIWTTVAVQLAPVIGAVAESFTAWSKTSLNSGEVVSTALNWIVEGVAFCADTLQIAESGWQALTAVAEWAGVGILKAIEGIANGLGWLAKKLGLTKSDWGASFGAMADDLGKMASESWDKALTPKESAGFKVEQWYQGIQAKAAALRQKGDSGGKDTENYFQRHKDALEYLDTLKKQQDYLEAQKRGGFAEESSRGAKLHELAQQGVSQAIRDQLALMDKQLTALEKQKKAHDELVEASKKTKEGLATATPIGKIDKELESLRKQFDLGTKSGGKEGINKGEYDKAMKLLLPDEFKTLLKGPQNAWQQYQEKKEEAQNLRNRGIIGSDQDLNTILRNLRGELKLDQGPTKISGMAEFGSKEAMEHLLNWRTGAKEKPEVQVAKDQLVEQRATNRLLEQWLSKGLLPVGC
jgi:hypothetical protein